jgi:ATP-dependent RNA helicase DeaD
MNQFEHLSIRQDIFKGISALGFAFPTAVQQQVIPLVLLQQSDLIGLAQTGTGKTAAFGIPLIQLADTSHRSPQSLVLCPTRELCVQVARDLKALAKFVPQLKILAVYGGSSIDQQIKSLEKGVQIAVATPGRMKDLINRGKISLSSIGTVVLDEADEMLQMGFQEELEAIMAAVPEKKRTLLFSATMPKAVTAMARKFMRNPIEITVGQRNSCAENVQHVFYLVNAQERYLALKRIIDINPDLHAIVFCRTRLETVEISSRLVEDGYVADALHGELPQNQRDAVMQKFRCKTLQILVATDVAARGLDVNDLTHVINYNLPGDIANYTHRSGRTGRAGKKGISLSIINRREKLKISEFERQLNRKFTEERIPTGREICLKRLFSLIDDIKRVEVDQQIDTLLDAAKKELASMDREELIRRLISREMSRVFNDYRNAPDLNATDSRKEKRTRKANSPAVQTSKRFTGLQFNVGKKDGMHASRLIGEINEMTKGLRIRIGRIEVSDNMSFLEADSKFAPLVIDAMQRRVINGKPVLVKIGDFDSAPRGRNSKVHSRKKSAMQGPTAGRRTKKTNIYRKNLLAV